MSEALSPTTLAQKVADRLRQWVVEGRYQPGDRLPTFKELAAELAVGLSSVREAARTLEHVGLIRVKHGQGIFVTDSVRVLSESLTTLVAMKRLQLRTIFEARVVVETGAAVLAAERATAADLDAMAAKLEQMESGRLGPAELAQVDTAFHEDMLRSSGNPVLTEIGRNLLQAVLADMEYVLSQGERRESAIAEHQEILNALRARDTAALRAALERHLAYGLQVHESVLERLRTANRG